MSAGVRLTAVNMCGRQEVDAGAHMRHVSRLVMCHPANLPTGRMCSFFSELADLLDRLISSVEPVLIVGDLNIKLDCPNEAASRRLHELFASYGLSCCVSSPTGLVDVVVKRAD